MSPTPPHVPQATEAQRLHDAAARAQTRVRRWRRFWVQGQALVLMSFLVDGCLLLALAFAGTLPMSFPIAFAAHGVALWALFHGLGYSKYGCERYEPRLTALQSVLVTTCSMGFVAWQPQAGLLIVMGAFTIFAFAALRMSTRWVMGCAVVVGLECVGGVVLLGDRIGLPTATHAERAVTGMWFALLLVRSAAAGFMGSQVRRVLARKNAALADTFQKLDHLAHHDELTGSLNRRSVMRSLRDEHLRMHRSHVPFSVMLFDVDHFKRINDTHGHAVGDEVLRRLAARAQAEMRTTDRLGRYGGEEFLCVFTSTSDETAALMAAERVRLGVADIDWSDLAPGLTVTLSGGLAMGRTRETLEQLLARADAAMYAAKGEGRNRVRKG